MPPECVTDEHAYLSPAADVYALGLLLFHMVAGRGAYDAMTLPAILDSKRRGEIPPLPVPSLPLCVLYSQCLCADRKKRPSMTDVRDQLIALLPAVCGPA